MAITFRLITPDDIPTLHRWRNLPHVSEWWQPPNPSYDLAHREYTAYMRPDGGVAAFMVALDGHDFAHIERWQVDKFPDYRAHVTIAPGTVGLDVFIGDVDYLHQGWGTRLMRLFLRDHVFSDPTIPTCIIDPLPENKAAIRAYEKVGFRHEVTFQHDGVGVYFMRLPRESFDNETGV